MEVRQRLELECIRCGVQLVQTQTLRHLPGGVDFMDRAYKHEWEEGVGKQCVNVGNVYLPLPSMPVVIQVEGAKANAECE